MLSSKLLREGSIGLFIILGLIIFGGIIFFLKGARFQQNSYQVKLEFDNAGGLTEGGKVLYRGVQIGKIIAIQPSSNGVEITTEINSKLPIPQNVQVSTLKSGLLGEVSVNIIPEQELSPEAEEISPLSPECPKKGQIICNNQVISAKASPDLIESLTRLSSPDSELMININDALQDIGIAGQKAAMLSEDLAKFMQEVKQDITKVSQAADTFKTTAESINYAANVTTEQINKLGNEFSNTSRDIDLLINNLNRIVDDNKINLNETITNVNQTTKQINQLAQNTDQLISKFERSLSEEEVKQLIANLEKSSDNFAQITDSLLALSTQINDPANIVTLQQALDSARVTFANTAKITSDLDELTGDPQFRTNIRKLVNGLSNLVSYTDLLEKQVQLAIIFNSEQLINSDKSLVKFSQFKPLKPLNLEPAKYPTAFHVEPSQWPEKAIAD
jgi:phospholipid/cholesterol/gamma-HCH transport system substrate-binding protein